MKKKKIIGYIIGLRIKLLAEGIFFRGSQFEHPFSEYLYIDTYLYRFQQQINQGKENPAEIRRLVYIEKKNQLVTSTA